MVIKNPAVEVEHHLPANMFVNDPFGVPMPVEGDEKVTESKQKVEGASKGVEDPFARFLPQPEGHGLMKKFELRLLKELGEANSAAIPPKLIPAINEVKKPRAWTAQLYPDVMSLTKEEVPPLLTTASTMRVLLHTALCPHSILKWRPYKYLIMRR